MYLGSNNYLGSAAYLGPAPIVATWGRPMELSTAITDSVVINGTTGERKYLRFLQTRRFRQVHFEVRFDCDGTFATSPAKLFTLTTFVGSKQITPKKIN